ncbi:MAG: hypothetical protein LQ341_006997 [Variospora aurantia]|nr:MAG: hypothetical protein LQ341_006997 [Variospora aurantia]
MIWTTVVLAVLVPNTVCFPFPPTGLSHVVARQSRNRGQNFPWRNNREDSGNDTESPSSDETTTTTPTTNIPSTGDNSVLATINKWRSAFGADDLSWAQDLVDAASNTGSLNRGGANDNIQHHAPQGAAEVIAPGSNTAMDQDLQGYTPFEISLISWLCEKPGNTMGDACSIQTEIMATYNADTDNPTGHHDILVDNSYSQIGCAFTENPEADDWFGSQGQWVCDLRF